MKDMVRKLILNVVVYYVVAFVMIFVYDRIKGLDGSVPVYALIMTAGFFVGKIIVYIADKLLKNASEKKKR